MNGGEGAGGSGVGDETGLGFVTAWAEMGSATSRNPGGRVYNVRLAGPHRSVIVAGGLPEVGARRVAEAINGLLDEARGRRQPEPLCCGACQAPLVWSGQGRRPLYCSRSCRQQAYRHRRRA
ncbi:MAG TPA: hypothetical protein VGH66_07260 [Acidimicrobiales bacterium]